MGMRILPFLGTAGLCALVAACGFFDSEEREPWRAEVEARCLASKAVIPSEYIVPMPAINGPRICGLDHPFSVTALENGAVSVGPRARLSCAMIPPLEKWLAEVVQPAAMATFGQPVVEMRNLGSYGCRSRNNQRGAPLSEHAFANAVDVSSFKLADGREIRVKTGWKGEPEEQSFLRQVHAGACGMFTTVLGPGSDSFHYDHFHLDVRMHDPRGLRHVCKPTPAPASQMPMISVAAPPPPALPAPPSAMPPMPTPPDLTPKPAAPMEPLSPSTIEDLLSNTDDYESDITGSVE